MDAVKFLQERDRICNGRSCEECPIGKITLRRGCDFPGEDIEKIVEAVENWSRENPEEIGKKYIIEIDRVHSAYGYRAYHVKNTNGLWISECNLIGFEEYKGE